MGFRNEERYAAIHSYLNSFDYFCCVSVIGNIMPPEEHEDITKKTVCDDVIVLNFGEVIDSREYLKKVLESQGDIGANDCEGKEKIKQFVADTIMEKIEILHADGDKCRNGIVDSVVVS